MIRKLQILLFSMLLFFSCGNNVNQEAKEYFYKVNSISNFLVEQSNLQSEPLLEITFQYLITGQPDIESVQQFNADLIKHKSTVDSCIKILESMNEFDYSIPLKGIMISNYSNYLEKTVPKYNEFLFMIINNPETIGTNTPTDITLSMAEDMIKINKSLFEARTMFCKKYKLDSELSNLTSNYEDNKNQIKEFKKNRLPE